MPPIAKHWPRFALRFLPGLYVVILFLAPLLMVLRVSFYAGGGQSGYGLGSGGFYKPGTWTITNYTTLWHDGYFHDILKFTVELGIGVSFLSVLIGYALAYFIYRMPPRLKPFGYFLVLLPKLTNILVIIYGLKLILSNAGPVNHLLMSLNWVQDPVELSNNLVGVTIGLTYLIVPYVVLVMLAAFSKLDENLIGAARGLGASALNAFWEVTWPQSLPALSLASLMALIWGLGAFMCPYLLGSPDQITLAVEVQRQTFENINWPRGAATAVSMFLALGLCTVVFFGLSRLALRQRGQLR